MLSDNFFLDERNQLSNINFKPSFLNKIGYEEDPNIQVLCTIKHMRGVARFRHKFSLIGLISCHIVKAVNSLYFSCLSFFICMLAQES